MTPYHLFELLVVSAIVAASLFALLRRYAPQLLGRKPAATSGCANCEQCGPCASAPKPDREQAVQWRSR